MKVGLVFSASGLAVLAFARFDRSPSPRRGVEYAASLVLAALAASGTTACAGDHAAAAADAGATTIVEMSTAVRITSGIVANWSGPIMCSSGSKA